jgi:RsiW-degrading membrane proteinase PrsW (M82 family)
MYAVPPQGYGHRPPVPVKRDPEATLRTVGIILYIVGMLIGGLLLLGYVFVPALVSKNAGAWMEAMFIGALLALPAMLVYIWIPWVVDRYDPEPIWALLLVLGWGFVAACGFSVLVNSEVSNAGDMFLGKGAGDVLGACVSAPLVEEATKAMGVAFMFFFFRRQFDGVVDGVIYATFAALGFAACENILYYSRAYMTELASHKDTGVLVSTFVMRGILKPWGHPLYTSLTGLGFGIARETNKTWLKFLAPIGGYLAGAFLHSVWNTSATLGGAMLVLPVFFLFVVAFGVLLLFMIRRKGKIIQDHLKDEVLMGNMTPWELELVTSPVARLRATFSFGGGPGRQFVDAAARLALSKWHTGRATQGRKLTVSADMILPLRQDLHRLRAEVSRSMGRPVPQPQPWRAPPAQAQQHHAQQPQQHWRR